MSPGEAASPVPRVAALRAAGSGLWLARGCGGGGGEGLAFYYGSNDDVARDWGLWIGIGEADGLVE